PPPTAPPAAAPSPPAPAPATASGPGDGRPGDSRPAEALPTPADALPLDSLPADQPPADGLPTSIDPSLLHDPEGRLRRDLPGPDGRSATFSDRQAAAIERRGETLVSAGAGAGKTSVLVERYLRTLIEDEDLDTASILAITFTEKAAAEMRERLRRRLEALTGGGVLPQRWRLEEAWIGTFHAIAQRLLRRYALAAGLDPDVQVADETRAAELRRAAFDRAVAAWLRDPLAARRSPLPEQPEGLPVDAAAALDLAAAYGIDLLRDETLALLALRRTQGRDPAAGGHELSLPRALPLPPATDARGPELAAALRRAAADAVVEVREACSGPKVSEAGKRAADRVLAAAAQIEVDLDGAPTDGLPSSAAAAGWTLPARQAATVKGRAVEALREAVDRARRGARAAELVPHGVRELALREALLVATARSYRRLKREQALMDFDDLLLTLLDLLRRRPDVAERLRRRFRHVLVDEFQDTNPVQLALVDLLSAPERRFQVGDRLQAIYGFRHATVRGFDDAATRAEAVGGRLALDETFRCPSDVLALTNRVGLRAHADYQPLVHGHDRAPEDGRRAPAVELHVIADLPDGPGARPVPEPPIGGDDGEPEPPPIDPDEAGHVAALVRELLDAGRAPGEIALLVRRTAPVAALERALLASGIDAVPVVAAPLLETLEVRELEAWLRAVANPYDDVALLGALRLPTAGVDADALVPLAAEHRAALDRHRAAAAEDPALRRTPPPALWDTVRALDDEPATVPMPDAARDALDLQVVALLRHRGLARRAGPADLLAEIRADDAYRAAILARPGAARRWAAVAAFCDWVEGQEAAGDDLLALTRRIVADRADGPSAPVLTDGEAVRITTIHRSKGLEWPVVICCDLGSRINADRPRILVDPDPARDRIGMRLGTGPEAVGLWDHELLKAEADRAQSEEERRLLHVAMTRAKERLILCGTWPAATEGSGAEKRATGRLDGARAVPVAPGEGHDREPRQPPLRWLLPLIADPEAWPRLGEETLLEIADPTGAVERPATARMLVRDPHGVAMPAPLADDARPWRAPEDAVPDEPPPAADDEDDEDDGRHRPQAPPLLPLPDPVSYTRLAERLGLATDPRGVRDEDEPAPDGPGPPSSPAPAADGLEGRVRGAVVHLLLERRLAGRDPLAARGPATAAEVRAALAEELPEAGPLDDAAAAELAAIVSGLEATPPARRALALPVAQRHLERDLLFDVGGDRPLVQGVVDLWLDEGEGRVAIVDWKTNRLDGDQDPAAVVEHGYGLQRDVYGLAALLGGAREVEVAFVFAQAPERPVVARFTTADEPRLRTTVAAAIDRARTSLPRP
uniref:UvrD-helicase domain-containing protein n=1 Tax=Patulibacter defluvii TaxID=3095358 RepID=UPI002A75E757